MFVVDVVASLIATSSTYSWRHSMISDLGSSRCVTRDAFTTCSPDATAFNAGLVVAGLLVLAASRRLARSWDAWFGVATVLLGTGLVVLGVCPSSLSHPVHMTGAVLALPASALCMMASEVRRARITHLSETQAPIHPSSPPANRDDRSWTGIRMGACAMALVGCLDQLWHQPPVPAGIAEIIAVACVAGVMTLEALRLRRDWHVPSVAR